MSIRMHQKLIGICFMGLLCSFYNTAYGKSLDKETIVRYIEQGFMAAMEIDENRIQSEEFVWENIPGYESYRKVVEHIESLIENGDFPEIDDSSKTVQCIPEICRSVFLANGFDSSMFVLDAPHRKGNVAFFYFPEKVALEIEWYVERALIIEPILPDAAEAEIIHRQVNDLKEMAISLIRKAIPDISDELIRKYTDQFFTALENGPESVITSASKRKLSPDQIDTIYQNWDEILSGMKITDPGKRNEDDGEYKKRAFETIATYIRPLVKSALQEFDKNLPSEFYLPDKPQRLLTLSEQWTKDLQER